MIYAKGGAAFVPVMASVADTFLNVAAGCGNWIISTAVSDTVTTWTVGGGAEWAIWSSWSQPSTCSSRSTLDQQLQYLDQPGRARGPHRPDCHMRTLRRHR
jgi:hypothetical protein